MKTHRALLVKDGEITEVEIPESGMAENTKLRELIGGWLTTCFNIQSSRGAGHFVIGYCDDEGLLEHSANFGNWNVIPFRGELRNDVQPIAGPIVILGGNFRTGDSESLTDTDAARFYIDNDNRVIVKGRAVPYLRCKAPSLLKQIKENLKKPEQS